MSAFVLGYCVPEADGAQLPPAFIDSVVAIGSVVATHKPGEPPQARWFTEGTGFFYGYLVNPDADRTKNVYEYYLVTAGHVVAAHVADGTDVDIRLNTKGPGNGVQEFRIPTRPSAGQWPWFVHPNKNIDVAAVRVDVKTLHAQGIYPAWFPNDEGSIVADIGKLKDMEVSAGDGIFILGFPMNLAGEQKNYVIVRQGIIARISEMLDGASEKFMVDAFVFPGNSGGPVVLKPESASIIGTKQHRSACLIGIVLDYISYIDRAVSIQTHRDRITFEENSGLAEVLPLDYVDQAIKAWRESLPQPAPQKH